MAIYSVLIVLPVCCAVVAAAKPGPTELPPDGPTLYRIGMAHSHVTNDLNRLDDVSDSDKPTSADLDSAPVSGTLHNDTH